MVENSQLFPRTDLMLGQISYLKQIATTVLPADQASDPQSLQLAYPQIIVQMPQRVEMPQYRNGLIGRYSSHIDFYWDFYSQSGLMNALTMAEYGLTRIALAKYPCRYIRGTQDSPQPTADNTTSRPLWHGVILMDYELLERG